MMPGHDINSNNGAQQAEVEEVKPEEGLGDKADGFKKGSRDERKDGNKKHLHACKKAGIFMETPEANTDNVKTEGRGSCKGNEISFIQAAAAKASRYEDESCKGEDKAAEVSHGGSFFDNEILKQRGKQGVKVSDKS